MDLDGTLLDTDRLHYEAYKSVLKDYKIELSREEFYATINSSSIDAMLHRLGIEEKEVEKVKAAKYLRMISSEEKINLIDGVQEFLEGCNKRGVNMVVVTNTSQKIVEFYKKSVPVLNTISNWICREDYTAAKPSEECYRTAVSRYYKNEPYLIGFENTLNGYNALKGVSSCIYFITDKTLPSYSEIVKEDVFVIKNFCHFL